MKQDRHWKAVIEYLFEKFLFLEKIRQKEDAKTMPYFVEKIKHAQSLSKAEKIFSKIRSNGHKNNGANGSTAQASTRRDK
jgi:hypothetical protein